MNCKISLSEQRYNILKSIDIGFDWEGETLLHCV